MSDPHRLVRQRPKLATILVLSTLGVASACGAPAAETRALARANAQPSPPSASSKANPEPSMTTKTETPTPEARARELVLALSTESFDKAIATFDPDMAKAMPPKDLAETWHRLVAATGAFAESGAVKRVDQGGYSIVVLTCRFERASLDVKVAMDGQMRVAGLFFLPAQPPYSNPPYAATDAVEREVTVGSAPHALPGTLTLPSGKGPFPAVVLVHGSGPGDRDETVGQNKPFKDLALGLAAKGIAVLRFDKRTRVYGAQMKALIDAHDPSVSRFTVDDESVDDAVAAASLLEATPEIDKKRIFVVGHSLGGQLAPRIGKRIPTLAGVGILAGSTRPLADMMLEQMRYIASLDGKTSPEETKQLEAVDAARTRIQEIIAGAAPKPDEWILGAPPAYYIDLAKYDAPSVAAKLGIPIFVAQGGRDYQVTEVDYHVWEKALEKRPHVTKKLYPKLNHLFVSGEAKSVPDEYLVSSHVDEALIHDLAAWVQKPK